MEVFKDLLTKQSCCGVIGIILRLGASAHCIIVQLQSAYTVIPIVEVYAHTACVDLFTADETSDGIVTVDIRGTVPHIGMRIQRAVGIVDEGVAQDVIVPNSAHPSQLEIIP